MKVSSFGRKQGSRDLLIRNLATSVILYESVVTTHAKGRAVQPVIDRMIHIAQTDDPITARRKLSSYLTDKNAVEKVMVELVKRFGTRQSGFTRRLRMPTRGGDGAPQVLIQLTETVLTQPDKPEAKASKKAEAGVKDE